MLGIADLKKLSVFIFNFDIGLLVFGITLHHFLNDLYTKPIRDHFSIKKEKGKTKKAISQTYENIIENITVSFQNCDLCDFHFN